MGKTGGLVAFPILLRGKTDTCTIGAAALVRTAEGAGTVPGGGNQICDRKTRSGDLGLYGSHIVARGAIRHRVLPDQVFCGNVRSEIPGFRPHVTVRQLEPGAGEDF